MPSGCTRLERKIQNVFENGSIQIAVPVQPVDVAADDIDRPIHIGRPVAVSPGAVDVRRDGDAFAGIVRVAVLCGCRGRKGEFAQGRKRRKDCRKGGAAEHRSGPAAGG